MATTTLDVRDRQPFGLDEVAHELYTHRQATGGTNLTFVLTPEQQDAIYEALQRTVRDASGLNTAHQWLSAHFRTDGH